MGTTAGISGSIDAVQLQHLLGAEIVTATPTSLVLSGAGVSLTLGGTGFTYDGNEQLDGGTVTSIDFTDTEAASAQGRVIGHITGVAVPASLLAQDFLLGADQSAFQTIFSGNDTIGGAQNAPDLLRGYDGDDRINGAGGQDSMYGGNGDDILIGGSAADYLNGGGGADTMTGGGGKDVFEVAAGESFAVLGSGVDLGRLDHITDWTSNDFLQFTAGPVATSANYVAITDASYGDALAQSQHSIATGIIYTVAQVGADVIVFDSLQADAVVLDNTTLSAISQANVGGNPALAVQPSAAHGATVDLFNGSDMGAFQESQLSDASRTAATSTSEVLVFGGGTATMTITGTGFVYDVTGKFFAGTVTGLDITSPNGHFALSGANTPATVLAQAHDAGDADISTSALLSGDDVITVRGSAPGTDTSFTGQGWGGNDLMVGGGSFTNFDGGTGDDTIQAASAGSTYLRGNDGDDSIQGGVGFDDINGNKGNDTIQGDLTVGNDWLVGGQNNDSITAHAGQNLIYGNLGNDTLQGGNGADILRGGQGDDVLFAGSGNQFLSGDRGNDTVTAGSGNDTIHSSQDAGIDRILGYNPGHDVVQLDPGTVFSVTQVGADTVITMTGSPGTNEVILVGVQMTSLSATSIFDG